MAGPFIAVTALRLTTTNTGSKRISSHFAFERTHDSCSIIDFIVCLNAPSEEPRSIVHSLLLAATLLLDLRLRLPGAR